jgi:hypothetical protein
MATAIIYNNEDDKMGNWNEFKLWNPLNVKQLFSKFN